MLFIPTSRNGLFAQRFFIQSKFRARGNHYSNQGETISYRVTSFLLLEVIFNAFFEYISACESSFGVVETFFLTNLSFQLVESEFLFSGNSIIFYLQLFFLFGETIISPKIRFQQLYFQQQLKDFLERSFPPDGRQTINGRSL